MQADVAGTVPPTVFVPQPNVNSALVRLHRYEVPPVAVSDPERMFELVRAGSRRGGSASAPRLQLPPQPERPRRMGLRAGGYRSERPGGDAHARGMGRAGERRGGRRPEVRVDAFPAHTLAACHRDACRRIPSSTRSSCRSVSRVTSGDPTGDRSTMSVSGPNPAGVPTDETNLAARAAPALGAESRSTCKGHTARSGPRWRFGPRRGSARRRADRRRSRRSLPEIERIARRSAPTCRSA